MRRRDFIAFSGGAAAAWTLDARAQQAGVPVVGFLRSTQADDLAQSLFAAVRAGLNEAGYVDGRNVAFEVRWGEGQRDRLAALAADLVRKPVAVIVSNGISAMAAKTVTSTVPIVFVHGSDPVRQGLVASFNRPGANITGVCFLSGDTAGKRLELLRQLTPGIKTIGVLLDASTQEGQEERSVVEAAAKAVGQELVVIDVRTDRDLEPAFASMSERGVGAVFLGTGAFITSQHRRLAALALRHRLPATRGQREFAAAGGLMTYGTSLTDAYRQAGGYAARILKGESPGELPVLQATRFELVLNLKTAKALGLNVPLQIHAAADEVIE